MNQVMTKLKIIMENIVRLVIVLCLVVGGGLAYLKTTSLPNDYVGTEKNPGINISK